MIKQFINLLVFLSLSCSCLNSAIAQSQIDEVKVGKGFHGCSISISTKKSSYASGEPISLNVALKNAGTTDLVVERGGFAHYSITVFFNNKESIPLTLYGKKILERSQIGGSLALLSLQPGKKTSMEFPLSRLFDFSLSGDYEVSVTRKIKDPSTNTWVDVRSNKIEFDIDNSFVVRVIE